MHFLGIDFGEKRLGLSHGDNLGVASPLAAIIETDASKRWEKLSTVIKERKITELVLGMPYNMDGTKGFKAKEVEAFALELKKRFSLPVHFIDETLTSYEAEQTIPKAKRRAVRQSGLIDSRAACLILQDYLDLYIPAPSEE